MAEQKNRRQLFDREREVAKKAREAINNLKPLRFTTDWLMAEIKTGGERARDIVALILHVEDLTVALTETISEAEAAITAARQMAIQQAQAQGQVAAMRPNKFP